MKQLNRVMFGPSSFEEDLLSNIDFSEIDFSGDWGQSRLAEHEEFLHAVSEQRAGDVAAYLDSHPEAVFEGDVTSNLTPFMLAAGNNDVSMLRLLLAAAVTNDGTEEEGLQSLLAERSGHLLDGLTPMLHAALGGSPDAVEFLLSLGAKVPTPAAAVPCV